MIFKEFIMPGFEELQGKLRQTAKKKPTTDGAIEIVCDTLEEGIKKASSKFQVTRDRIKYEILEEGSKGTLGIGKKPYRIKAWKIEKPAAATVEDKPQPEQEVDKNGDYKIKITKEGIFLAVTPPKGKGTPISYNEVQQALFKRKISDSSPEEVKKIVDEQTGEFVKIGNWYPNPNYDAKIQVEVASDMMEAYVIISPPIFTGRLVEKEEVVETLHNEGVVKGILKDNIDEIFEKELWNQRVLVARGQPAVNGENGYIDYKFKVNPYESIEFKEDEQGRVHYDDMDIVQNVVEEQILAVKIPPSKGKDGFKINGDSIPAKDGEDIAMPIGKNVKLSDDSNSILADAQGQAVLSNGLVSVEPILTIEKDVGVETGNITFLGTVIVKGNVDDGYSIKASQNVEIFGSVGKANIEAEGNVVIHGGFQGKEEGYIHAEQNFFAKFVNSANVEVGKDVIVLDGILHSSITAGDRVICQGKKGKIVGGKILASKEINAKELGSYGANTETKLEAGTDPKARAQIKQLEDEKLEIEQKLKNLTANIETLKKIKEQHGALPADKETMFKRMLQAQLDYRSQLDEIEQDLTELRRYLNDITTHGKISARDNVYPGVDVTIRGVNMRVKNDFSYVTFINDAGTIRPTAYQEVGKLKEIAKGIRAEMKTSGKKE